MASGGGKGWGRVLPVNGGMIRRGGRIVHVRTGGIDCRMTLTTRVLIGLVAGLAAGLALSAADSPALPAVVAVVEPVGTLWVNAIRMTVVPLVVSLLIVGVASSSDARSIGRVGRRALLLFLVILSLTAALTVGVAAPLFGLLSIDPAVSAALRAGAAQTAGAATEGAAQVPGPAAWLVSLVPTNPVRAAADGAMLPLIVFSLAFGLALTRVESGLREHVVRVFRAVADAMLVLVQWVLVLSPVGVFALALPLATRMGIAAAGALAFYVGAVVLLCLAVMALLLYPAAVFAGRVPLGRFARAAFPAQAVAFSARSSLAALPPMIEEAERRLRLPPEIISFFLPLSASVFRVGGAVGIPAGVLFVCRLYGVDLDLSRLLAISVTSVLLTFSIPGIPAGSIFIMAPVLLVAGAPVEGLGILLGVDTIPDMFRTTLNVTGHLSAASVLGRSGEPAPREDAGPRLDAHRPQRSDGPPSQ